MTKRMTDTEAAESVVLNLAEAARLKDAPARLKVSDYAIGSALECAGCRLFGCRPDQRPFGGISMRPGKESAVRDHEDACGFEEGLGSITDAGGTGTLSNYARQAAVSALVPP